jgi:hypothetical protein
VGVLYDNSGSHGGEDVDYDLGYSAVLMAVVCFITGSCLGIVMVSVLAIGPKVRGFKTCGGDGF